MQTYVSPDVDRANCRSRGGNNSQGAIYKTQVCTKPLACTSSTCISLLIYHAVPQWLCNSACRGQSHAQAHRINCFLQSSALPKLSTSPHALTTFTAFTSLHLSLAVLTLLLNTTSVRHCSCSYGLRLSPVLDDAECIGAPESVYSALQPHLWLWHCQAPQYGHQVWRTRPRSLQAQEHCR